MYFIKIFTTFVLFFILLNLYFIYLFYLCIYSVSLNCFINSLFIIIILFNLNSSFYYFI